jgi:diguanylate cyclase (GGDEF)-like protein
MWLYTLLSRLFPTSFTAKVFAVAFVGTHVPLLALALRALSANGPLSAQADVLTWALVATLAGTGATLAALWAILAPLYRVEEAMRRFEEAQEVLQLPFGYADEVGRLMARTNRLVLHVDERMEEKAREAETDPLTGVLNRRGWDARLRRPDRGAILLVDIDRFKAVNDRFGHAEGDRVLVRVATTLSAVLRRGDVLARIGGEEFAVFLQGATAEQAMHLAERLRAAVAAEVRAGDLPVTISVGVSPGRAGPSLADRLVEADRGVYAAKDAGRNRVMSGMQAAGVAP